MPNGGTDRTRILTTTLLTRGRGVPRSLAPLSLVHINEHRRPEVFSAADGKSGILSSIILNGEISLSQACYNGLALSISQLAKNLEFSLCAVSLEHL